MTARHPRPLRRVATPPAAGRLRVPRPAGRSALSRSHRPLSQNRATTYLTGTVTAHHENGAAMSAKDHPNNAPGVPMLFPPWFERFQVKYFNPAVKPFARYL